MPILQTKDDKMPNTTDLIDTPRYLLKSGSQAIFPTINFENPDTNCVCVYGFSDKPIYDKFIERAEQLLTPYPLVKGYLTNQIAEASSDGEGTHLAIVILDAAGPKDPILSAASMATVLLAEQEKATQVQTEFRLAFDSETKGYRFDKGDMQLLQTMPNYIVSNP